MKEKKRFQAPHVFVLVFAMIVVATLLTYILPAGAYDRYVDEATGRTLVDAATYHAVEQTPVGLFAMLQSLPQGLMNAVDVVITILVYGGAFGIITATGVIDKGLSASIRSIRRYSFLIIPVVMIVFSMLGALLGIAESTMAFIPLCIMLSKAMGYDEIVGLGMVFLANVMGFTAGPLNMWTTGVAQGIAELPLFSGQGVRWVVYVIFMVLLTIYILYYAKRIKADPTRSVMYDPSAVAEQASMDEMDFGEKLTTREKITLIATGIGFAGMIYGLIGAGWWSGTVIGAYLLGMAIVVGLIGGLRINDVANGFLQGAHNVLMGALVVGFARGILIVLQSGNVIDTILYAVSNAISGLPSVIAAVCIYIFQFFFNFLVPSGSGQAATTMPLIVPLADLLHVTRQTSVLAFQFGDGFTNALWPTAVLPYLAIANIPYSKWLKWFLPFVGIVFVTCCVIIGICAAVSFGPF